MRCCHILPDDYEKIKSFSFTENKKLSYAVNGIALIVAALLVVPMLFAVPFDLLSASNEGEAVGMFIKSGVLFLLLISYILLHEGIHGIFIRYISGKWGKFGYRSGFAYASSEAFFGKRKYVIIAAAPIVILGIVIGIANILVPSGWFWIVYIIQVVNISGAVGDAYVIYTALKLPEDCLIKDDGLEVAVFSKTSAENNKE